LNISLDFGSWNPEKDDSPRGVTARPSWIVSTSANTPQGEREDTKHAKFGEIRKNFLCALGDLARITLLKRC